MKIESGGSNSIGVFYRRAAVALRVLPLAACCACSFVNEKPPADNAVASPTAAATIAEQQQQPTPTPRKVPEKPPLSFPPRLEAALKKTIAARINAWRASIEARDLDKHLQFYADGLEGFYLQQNVGRDVVSAERTRAFAEFDAMKMQLINIDIQLESTDAATVVLDKSWDFKKAANFSNGLVQHEMKWRKIDKRWLIVSERDLQIYRYHNS